ncbi:hypothetical protein Tco_1398125 [Tanacetum coccineum]
MAAYSEEEVEAFLATTIDYNPACKTTFMSEFDSLFNKSYPYVEKLAESFWLPLGDLHNMWSKGNVRHLAIGYWTHPERLAFQVMYVTWPLALGLIWNVLRSRSEAPPFLPLFATYRSHSGMLPSPYRVLPTSDPACPGLHLVAFISFGKNNLYQLDDIGSPFWRSSLGELHLVLIFPDLSGFRCLWAIPIYVGITASLPLC